MEKSVSIQELQNKTDQLLSWVEERKMNGFMGNEIDYFRGILEACLEKETFGEICEQMKEEVRKWIRKLWNPSVIGRTYVRFHNRTPRAEVIKQFPSLLTDYLEVLSNIAQYELNDEEIVIYDQIILRVKVSTLLLELKESEKENQEEKKKKSRRSKPPRCDK